jgi:hypothetical protein
MICVIPDYRKAGVISVVNNKKRKVKSEKRNNLWQIFTNSLPAFSNFSGEKGIQIHHLCKNSKPRILKFDFPRNCLDFPRIRMDSPQGSISPAAKAGIPLSYKTQKTNAMKTIVKILIAVIALFFISETHAADRSGYASTTPQISYVVNINATQLHSGFTTLALFVLITDESGRLVAPVQVVRPGLSIYSFNEIGPVKGTRVAHMIYEPINPSSLPFYCAPDSKTGSFQNGGSYLFNLYPTTNPPQAQ